MHLYDDKFLKGLVSISGTRITQLCVDPFFVGMGIDSALLTFAICQLH